MLRFVRPATVVLLSILIGCSDSTGPFALALNRARWEGQNLHDYAYRGRMSCFCGYGGQYVTVLVLADTVNSATLEGSGQVIPRETWRTVEELFDFAQHARDGNVERVRVEYHREMGYPTLIELSCSPNIADCGTTLEITDLGPVPSID